MMRMGAKIDTKACGERGRTPRQNQILLLLQTAILVSKEFCVFLKYTKNFLKEEIQ